MKMTYLARPQPGCKPESNTIAWADVERLTRNQLGRTIRSTCPICSEHRSPANRRARCFAVRLKDPDFAIFNCLNCGISGHVRPDTPSRVIDFAEQQRLRNEARRRDEDDRAERTESALRVWKQRRPFRGSPAEDYLHYTRGIGDWLDVFPYLDEAFGFHPKCTFGSDRLPCMLALVRDIQTDAEIGIHRTALGSGPRPGRIGRKSLGPIGGGAIKISPDHDVTTGLLVGEGIETVLSASALLSFRPIWSLIDKGNLAKFPVLPGIECLTVAADNDSNGTGQAAAAECAERWNTAGREVISTKTTLAKDFNDAIRGQKNDRL